VKQLRVDGTGNLSEKAGSPDYLLRGFMPLSRRDFGPQIFAERSLSAMSRGLSLKILDASTWR